MVATTTTATAFRRRRRYSRQRRRRRGPAARRRSPQRRRQRQAAARRRQRQSSRRRRRNRGAIARPSQPEPTSPTSNGEKRATEAKAAENLGDMFGDESKAITSQPGKLLGARNNAEPAVACGVYSSEMHCAKDCIIPPTCYTCVGKVICLPCVNGTVQSTGQRQRLRAVQTTSARQSAKSTEGWDTITTATPPTTRLITARATSKQRSTPTPVDNRQEGVPTREERHWRNKQCTLEQATLEYTRA
jgi:hypothetical protein